jgi:hypothetical protein
MGKPISSLKHLPRASFEAPFARSRASRWRRGGSGLPAQKAGSRPLPDASCKHLA